MSLRANISHFNGIYSGRPVMAKSHRNRSISLSQPASWELNSPSPDFKEGGVMLSVTILGDKAFLNPTMPLHLILLEVAVQIMKHARTN